MSEKKSMNKKNQSESTSNALVAVSKKQAAQIEAQNQILAQKTSFKNCYNLFNVSPNILSELLQKYAKDTTHYREEGFTQQADRFLSKISNSKKIPKELKTNYKLYEILISIAKIFMLNEYEIVVLGCALDHCGWKIQETVYAEEADLLKEFPGNFGDEEISSECKRLVIYLLVITFSLKQYLNEKSISDRIHAYCESICTNFQAIFNRWTRLSLQQKFNYSPLEINRKFRTFCEPDVIEAPTTNRNYDELVEEIMGMSGSYKSKINQVAISNTIELSVEVKPQPEPFKPIQSVFNKAAPTPSILFPPIAENKLIFANLPAFPPLASFGLEKKPASKIKFPEINLEGYELPEIETMSRRSSSNNHIEELGRKKLRLNPGVSGMTTMNRENSLSKDFPFFLGNNLFKTEADDLLMNFGFPSLSKRSSHLSQVVAEEQPDLFRFKSNLSSWYEK